MFTTTDFTVQANSIAFVTLFAPQVKTGVVTRGSGTISGSPHFRRATGLHPFTAAINNVNHIGLTSAAVVNSSGQDIIVRKGSEYGSFTIFDEEQTNQTATDLEPAQISAFVKAQRIEVEESQAAMPAPMTLPQKRKWLMDHFKLNSKPCLGSPQRLEAAIQLLLEFWDFFSHDGSFGKTSLLSHRIITEDVPPIKSKYRPVNPRLEQDLRQTLDKWLQHDVIEPANSPWSFNLVPVKKKNGKIRWCIDWRQLNDITKKDSFPMPTVKDSLARLAGSTIFSGIDMEGAFHCIELDKRDRAKTAFGTPFGSYQQKRLGFGLTNGPSAYCRLVEKIVSTIPENIAIAFLDDAVIHAKTFDEHIFNLRTTLAARRSLITGGSG